MNYVPNRFLKKTYTVSAILAVLGLIAIMCASLGSPPVLFQLVGVVLCAFGIFILYRYALAYYIYTVDDDDFAVTRVTGKKNLTVCRIAYTDIHCMRSENTASTEYDGKTRGKYDYTVNFDPGNNTYFIFVQDGERYSRIALECSEDFARVIASRLAPDAEVIFK